jgi:hypothetical protein
VWRTQSSDTSTSSARTAQNVKSAEQQQAFVVRQFLAIRSPQQNGARFRRGVLDSQCAHSDGEVRQLLSVATASSIAANAQ